jgi:hypothetical protein
MKLSALQQERERVADREFAFDRRCLEAGDDGWLVGNVSICLNREISERLVHGSCGKIEVHFDVGREGGR